MSNETVSDLDALSEGLKLLSAKCFASHADIGGVHAARNREYLGAELFDSLALVLERESALAQVEAVSEFVLEVLLPLAVGEGEPDFLGAVPDEVQRGGKLANFGVLRRVFQAGGHAGAYSEVGEGVSDGFPLAGGHDDSPYNGKTFSVDAPIVGESK